MTKIEIIVTCPKSKLSLEGTNGPLGVKHLTTQTTTNPSFYESLASGLF